MRKSVAQRFCEMSRLYHFTNFNAAYKIIESNKLRFSKSFKLNDLIESNRVVFERTISEKILEKENYLYDVEEELNRYQQISFSQDKECDGRYFVGFDLHTMWGLYANRGYGVCLVFDKMKLNIMPNDYVADVTYDNFVPQRFICHNKSKKGIRSEIWRRKDEVFFHKRKEWEYEQEYRLIRRTRNIFDDEYLDITKSLSFIIICKDDSVCGLESMFDSYIYKDFHYINKKIPILTYEYGLDRYTLYEKYGLPIWNEEFGFL